MFGMMMNKSRRLLRRASTRENLLRKERERQGELEEENGNEIESPHQTKEPPFRLLSDRYVLDIAETDEFDCQSEDRRKHFTSRNGMSKKLTRSSSCTNVLLGHHIFESKSSPVRLGNTDNVYGKSLTSIRIGNLQRVSVSTGSCKDLTNPSQAGSEGCMGLTESSNLNRDSSGSGHVIGIQLQIGAPDGHADKSVLTSGSSSERVDGGVCPDQDGTISTRDVIKPNETGGSDTKPSTENSQGSSTTAHPTKTLLRSRSCSFIVSLSYLLDGSPKVTRAGGVTDSPRSNATGSSGNIRTVLIDSDSSTRKEQYNTGPLVPGDDNNKRPENKVPIRKNSSGEIQSGNQVFGPVSRFRRLRKSRSLLHFAGFSRDSSSSSSFGKGKPDPLESGRKSTIMENEDDEDSFDDIMGKDISDSKSVGTNSNDGLYHPGEQKVPAEDASRDNISEAKNSNIDCIHEVEKNIESEKSEVKESHSEEVPCADEKHEIKDNDEDVHKDEQISTNAVGAREKASDKVPDTVESDGTADHDVHQEDHKCSLSDCRQCQFMSQFLVPDSKPGKPPSPDHSNNSRDRIKYKRNKLKRSTSKCSADAYSLPAINLPHQESKEKSAHRVKHRGILYTSRAVSAAQMASIESGLNPHPPRSQPHRSKFLHPLYAKKPSYFQSRISTLTRALGIFAKRNHMISEESTQQNALITKDQTKEKFAPRQELCHSKLKNVEKTPIQSQSSSEQSVEQVCNDLGVPVNKRVIRQKTEPLPGPETIVYNSPKRTATRSEYRERWKPSKCGNGETISAPRITRDNYSNTKSVFSSPNSRKKHLRTSGISIVSGAHRKTELVCDAHSDSTDSHNTAAYSLKTLSAVKNNIGNTRTGFGLLNRNRHSSKVKTKIKTSDFVSDNYLTQEGCSPIADGTKGRSSSTDSSAPDNFAGFYRVLPPIDQITSSDLRQQPHQDNDTVTDGYDTMTSGNGTSC